MTGWSLLFATPLLAYEPPSFSMFSFYPLYLVVPFAALLGRRYGASGVVAIAVGGLAFVISVSIGPVGWIGGNPGLYLIALAVAAIAAMPRPFLESLHWPQDDRSVEWLSFAAPFLLVLYLGIRGGDESGGDLQLSFSFGFSLLGYFLLFVLGVGRVRMAALMLGLAVVATLTWVLNANGLLDRPDSNPYLSFSTLQPSMVLAAIAMVSAGAATRAFMAGKALPAFWRRPYLSVTVLMLLWFGPPPLAAIPIALGSIHSIEILQVSAALPLAAFMAGLLRGARGTIFVTAIPVVFTLVWTGVLALVPASTFGFYAGDIRMDAPLVAACYALMGAKLAEVRSGVTSFQMLRFPVLLFVLFLLVLGATIEIWGDGGPGRMALSGLFIAGVMVILFFAWRLHHAMAARGLKITSEKWAGFVVLLGIAGTVVTNLQFVGQSLKQLLMLVLVPLSMFGSSASEQLHSDFGSMIDSEELVMSVVILLACVFVIRGVVRVLPKIYSDARKIATFVRTWRRDETAHAVGQGE